jgi:hypothetical protein
VSVTLTNPINRGSNTGWRVSFIGTNWDNQDVIVRITFNSGDVRDYRFAPQGGFATIAQLTASVDNFAGLRNSMESYLASADATLAGTVT